MRSVAAAVRMDWVRVTTIRTTAVLIVSMIGLSLTVCLVIAASLRGERLDPEVTAVLLISGGSLIPVPFLAVFMGIFGALMVGHDYRHGLVRPVLTAIPNRFAVAAGRMVVLAFVSLAAGTASVLLNAGCALLVLDRLPLGPGVVRACGGYLALGVLWSWLAAGATWLLRSTAAVLVLLFVVPLVIEPVITVMGQIPPTDRFAGPLVDWLPFAAGRTLALTGQGAGDALSPGQGGALFGAVVLLVALSGTARFILRDA